MPMGRAALKLVMREVIAPQPGAGRPRLSAGHARRRRRDHAFPATIARPTLVITARSLDPARPATSARARASRSSPRRRSAGAAATSRRRGLLPNVLAKTGGAQSGRLRGLVRRRRGLGHRRRVHQRLDRHRRGRARDPRPRAPTSCRRHPQVVLDVLATHGINAIESAHSPLNEAARRARGLHHRGAGGGDAGGRDRRQADRRRASRAR